MALDFYSKTFQLSDGSVVNVFIYDTCGQEKYNAINKSYYHKADAILLVYDISNKKSFNTIKKFYCQKIKEFCKKNIPIILLGNKADLPNREVQTEEGIALALQEKYKFKETSCVKNENVADAFEALIEMWNIERSHNIENENLSLEDDKNANNKKGGCCS
jgi:small GTP-binding protein